METKKVVLGLSGGMDSSTLAYYYLTKGYEVHPVTFNYGSKHNKYENEAAQKIIDFYKLQPMKYVELPFIGELFKSNLLQSGGDIPEGHYSDASMSKTVVPGRNIIFTSILAGYAWSIGAEIIGLGVHAGDRSIYEDCRAGFIAAMNAAVIQGTGDRVRLEAPFQYLDKTGILEIGYSVDKLYPVPYELTRTCYKDQENSCGVCGSCSERLEAFANIGIFDPIKYDGDETNQRPGIVRL
jgi:7-cyano-7-deazaguanine synthase